MKKNVLMPFAAAAVVMMGLTACQNGSHGENAPASQEKGSNSGMTEITFWHSMDSVFGEITQKQVDQFNDTIGKEKNIHVTPVFQNWPGTDALSAAMPTDDIKNMPDVIQLYSESVNLLRDYKRTVWAEDRFTEDGSLKKEDLMPGAAKEYSINGKMIGVPWTASALLLYYNQDYLDQAGVSVPKTIGEMAEALPVLARLSFPPEQEVPLPFPQ